MSTIILALQVFLNFQTTSFKCESKVSGGRMRVGIVHTADKIDRVVLSNYEYNEIYRWIYKAIELTPSERERSELYRDADGQYWLKTLALDEASLAWLLFYPSEREGTCRVPAVPREVTPRFLALDFEMEGVDMGVPISYGTRVAVSGTAGNGESFRGSLRLKQRRADH